MSATNGDPSLRMRTAVYKDRLLEKIKLLPFRDAREAAQALWMILTELGWKPGLSINDDVFWLELRMVAGY